jgi:hypothetical protein
MNTGGFNIKFWYGLQNFKLDSTSVVYNTKKDAYDQKYKCTNYLHWLKQFNIKISTCIYLWKLKSLCQYGHNPVLSVLLVYVMMTPIQFYYNIKYDHGYVPLVINTSRPLSIFMTYHQVYNYINTTGVTSGKGTAYPSGAPVFTPGFSGIRVTRSLVLCVCFVHLCLFFCPFFFWPSCCLSFFDLQIKITPLISSNSSHHLHISKHKTELCWLIKPIYMYL